MKLRYSLKLNLSGTNPSGGATLWRLASAEAGGLNPAINSVPIVSLPETLTLPRFGVSIYSLFVK